MRDLKNTVRIEELGKESGKVYVTKNGYGRLVEWILTIIEVFLRN